MTKDEILNLDNKEYFIASLNIIDKDRIKNIQDYLTVEEVITTEQTNTVVIWQDENGNDITEEQVVTITDTIVYLAKKYKEWENWMSVQKELFI